MFKNCIQIHGGLSFLTQQRESTCTHIMCHTVKYLVLQLLPLSYSLCSLMQGNSLFDISLIEIQLNATVIWHVTDSDSFMPVLLILYHERKTTQFSKRLSAPSFFCSCTKQHWYLLVFQATRTWLATKGTAFIQVGLNYFRISVVLISQLQESCEFMRVPKIKSFKFSYGLKQIYIMVLELDF